MIDDERIGVEDGQYSTESEFVVTGRYRQDEDIWLVVTSMSVPLLEMYLREDVLTPVEA